MLVIPPFGASSNIALWRANIKPPVELVVDDLDWSNNMSLISIYFFASPATARLIPSFVWISGSRWSGYH